MQNLAIEYLRNTVRRFPDRTAIVDGDTSVSYAQLWEQSIRLADSIRALQPGDVIAVPIPKSLAALAAFAAVQLCGAVYVPLDPKTPAQRRQKMLDKLGPHSLLEYSDGEFRLDGVACPASVGGEVDQIESDLFAGLARRGGHDPLYVMFTSGTTGIPKGVTISNLAVIDYTDWVIDAYDIDENETIANSVPLFFDGSVLDVYTAFARGCTLHLVPAVCMRFPADFVDYLKKHEVTLIFCVPSALASLVKLDQLADVTLPHLRKVLFIGEPLPLATVRYFQERLPAALISNQYGPTEITVTATYWHAGGLKDVTEIPIGGPCHNTHVVLLDDEQRYLDADDEIGEVAIGGLGVSLGYWNEPELTAERFIQNPQHNRYRDLIYRTGDLGYRNSSDGLYYMVGRQDHQFKHLGHRIEAGEIENAILALPDVHQCVCHYDEERQQIAALLYAAEPLSVRDLKQQLAQTLPSYMIPQRVENIGEFPLTPNGKIDRQAVCRMMETPEKTVTA